jgi:chromosome segregation ATPase
LQIQEQSLKLQSTSKELNKTVAVNNDLKKQLDKYETKFQLSEVANSCLKKQLDEYETKFQQSEVANSGLKKQQDEYETKFQQSDLDNSGLKKQLEAKEEVLKSIKEKQTQLQTTIDGLTKTLKSLNQTVQGLHQKQKYVSTYTIAAVALIKWTEISPGICRAKHFIVRGLSKKYPTLGREKEVLYLGGYNT